MSLSIQPVSRDNWRALARLKVREDQAHFVASNVYSIAEARFGFDEADGSHWEMYTLGIYDAEIPVGFLMYGYNFSTQDFQAFIIRLMVDANHQGKGYGRFGMQKMLEIFRQDERIKTVGISYEPENEAARKLYASLGFVETGEIHEGEAMAVYKIR
ncbi:MAG: GNAT family N-acetyltransferase [Chloroflexota bacterium]